MSEEKMSAEQWIEATYARLDYEVGPDDDPRSHCYYRKDPITGERLVPALSEAEIAEAYHAYASRAVAGKEHSMSEGNMETMRVEELAEEAWDISYSAIDDLTEAKELARKIVALAKAYASRAAAGTVTVCADCGDHLGTTFKSDDDGRNFHHHCGGAEYAKRMSTIPGTPEFIRLATAAPAGTATDVPQRILTPEVVENLKCLRRVCEALTPQLICQLATVAPAEAKPDRCPQCGATVKSEYVLPHCNPFIFGKPSSEPHPWHSSPPPTQPPASTMTVQDIVWIVRHKLTTGPTLLGSFEGGAREKITDCLNALLAIQKDGWQRPSWMDAFQPPAEPTEEDWRVGRKVRTNVYAGDRPVCQCHSEFDASLIVAAVNGVRHPSPISTGEQVHVPAAMYRGMLERDEQQERELALSAPPSVTLLNEVQRIVDFSAAEVPLRESLRKWLKEKRSASPSATGGEAFMALFRQNVRELAELQSEHDQVSAAHDIVCGRYVELETEIVGARKDRDTYREMCTAKVIQLQELRSLADQRGAALRKYGQHLSNCWLYVIGGVPCDCGLAEALASAPADFAHITHDIDKITENVIAASAPAKEDTDV